MIMKLDSILASFLFFFLRQSEAFHFLYIFSVTIVGLTPLQLNKKYRK